MEDYSIMIFQWLRKYLNDEEFNNLKKSRDSYKNNFVEVAYQYVELLKKYDDIQKKVRKI